jgi:SAM-dependent methyltransferase
MASSSELLEARGMQETLSSSATGREIQQSLRTFVADPRNAPTFNRLRGQLGVTHDAIEAACVRYSLQSMSSGNDIYDDAGTHVAMWIEYQALGSMHARRQHVILQELRRARCRLIADIGFGAPTAYLDRYVRTTPGVAACLYDKFPAAIEVARAILGEWSQAEFSKLRFGQHDMDVDGPIAGCDAYLLLDAIEHALEPQRYLRETVAAAAQGALFLFHLPIGPLIASHHIAWGSAREAADWLTMCGLRVKQVEFILPNPDVDHFARGHVSLRNLFVVAHRP